MVAEWRAEVDARSAGADMNDTFYSNCRNGAVFSYCRNYRYSLWRNENQSGLEKLVAFIGLNPSTADEEKNDPTVKRCINFAERWGYGGMVMLNLFAFRATDPKVMRAENEPVGPLNLGVIQWFAERVGLVVTCWGNHGSHLDQYKITVSTISSYKLHHLGLTKTGQPKHPLYLRADTKPIPW